MRYTLGNEWMLLWSLLVAALVTWLIVRSRILDRLDRRLGPRRRLNLQALVIGIVYILASTLLTLPWSLYADYVRERSYGRTSQPLGDFLVQGTISTLVAAIAGGLFLMALYWLIRRAGRRWWLWSGALTALFFSFMLLLSPVLIEPLFNKYQPVPAGPVRDAVVEMAARAGVPPDRVFMYNGSRQSNNFTANAGGVGSTARVAISDVALNHASLDEVRAVTAHELGHYVLKHSWYAVLFYSIAAIFLFWVVDRGFPWFARRFGSSAGLVEPRGVPVLIFMLSLFGLLALPVFNTFSRAIENQADLYSLRTENRPDALASALVKTADYRDPRPGGIEEIIFYSHPRSRRACGGRWLGRPPIPGRPAAGEAFT